MTESSMQERNALDGRRLDRVPGLLHVTVAAESARFSLRVGEAARERAGECFGCALPAKIGQLARDGDRLALCLGPDEWFLMAPPEQAGPIAGRFAADLNEAPHSLVDISNRELGIEVQGAASSLALRAGCALDLDTMPSPSGTRTIFDKSQIVLLKHAADHYRIEVWQSFADHVWGILEDAQRDIALGI